MESGEKGAGSRARAAIETHGAVVARVCMALLGDAAAAERALERVAREAGGLPYADVDVNDEKKMLARLLGLARMACAAHLSKIPLRTNFTGPRLPEEAPATARDPSSPQEPIVARTKLSRLKPTEREAVILHLVGGLDVAGVGEACGVDVETARARIARGLSQLAEEKAR